MELAHQSVDVRRRLLARDNRKDLSMLRGQGDVIPPVPAASVGRLLVIPVGLLLGYEGSLPIELNLTREGE